MPADVHIVIIGAGAAGLAAAIFAAETHPHLHVTILDSARTIGAKILISGGGRCNVTNITMTPKDFHAPARTVERVLKQFNEQHTVQWFASMGVVLKQETTGKMFPVTNQAKSVLNALLRRCEELGIEIRTSHRVEFITKDDQRFHIETEKGLITTHRVIMATGGQSLPKSGSDGSGWTLAQQLGHTVTSRYPALVPLVLDKSFFHGELSGTSHQATVITTVSGKIIDRRTGSLLWTHFGISGPVVMDASRFWVSAFEQGCETTLSLSFLPKQTFEEIDHWLASAQQQPNQTSVGSLLSRKLPQRVVKVLCAYVAKEHAKTLSTASTAVIDVASLPLSRLSRQHRRQLTHTLTKLDLPIVATRGWNFAEVTAGGIPLGEVNTKTMASKKTAGLYLVGEMLDCDGRIGGFNFQWAWATGYIAGRKAGEEL